MAPLTRMRANEKGELGEMSVEYYSQRASAPGTLIIAEATLIAAKAAGYPYMPGIWSEEHIAGLKKASGRLWWLPNRY